MRLVNQTLHYHKQCDDITRGGERGEEVGHVCRTVQEKKALTDECQFPLPWKTLSESHKNICQCHKIIHNNVSSLDKAVREQQFSHLTLKATFDQLQRLYQHSRLFQISTAF